MLQVRYAHLRGAANRGWLESYHTFSFADYWDAKQQGFSDLRVINDDRIMPAKGFATHAHQNMEIFTYLLSGALQHQDSMGNGSVILPGDLQLMSAGSGITHSEFNHSASEMLHLLQIWVKPARLDTPPSYQQISLDPAAKRNQLRLIATDVAQPGVLLIGQDCQIYAGHFHQNSAYHFSLNAQRYAYLQVASGQLTVNDQPLQAGDGVRIRDESSLIFRDANQAEVLLFDLRPIDAVS